MPYAGQQFTPADPITVLGALLPFYHGLVRKTAIGRRVHIDLGNLSKKGYLVNVEDNTNDESKLRIVTVINPKYYISCI